MKDSLTNDIKTLIDSVAQPTEEKQPQAETIPVHEEVKETIEVEKAVEEKQSIITPKMIADETELAMQLIDGVQAGTFSMILNYKRKRKLTRLFGENAVDKTEILYDGEKEPETEDEKAMLKVEKQFRKAMDDMKLSDEEKEIFKPLLLEYIKRHRGKLPESFFQMMAVLSSVGGRFLTILTI